MPNASFTDNSSCCGYSPPTSPIGGTPGTVSYPDTPSSWPMFNAGQPLKQTNAVSAPTQPGTKDIAAPVRISPSFGIVAPTYNPFATKSVPVYPCDMNGQNPEASTVNIAFSWSPYGVGSSASFETNEVIAYLPLPSKMTITDDGESVDIVGVAIGWDKTYIMSGIATVAWSKGSATINCMVGNIQLDAALTTDGSIPVYCSIKADDPVTLLYNARTNTALAVGYATLPEVPEGDFYCLTTQDGEVVWDRVRGYI